MIFGCNCCEDRKTVRSITDELRPCSRCSAEDFLAWYRGKMASDLSDKIRSEVSDKKSDVLSEKP